MSADDFHDELDELFEKYNDFGLKIQIHKIAGAKPDWEKLLYDQMRVAGFVIWLCARGLSDKTANALKDAHMTLLLNFYDRHPESLPEHMKKPPN